MKPGVKPSPRREAISKKYNLSPKMRRKLTESFLDQLDRCKSDEAREILIFGTRYGQNNGRDPEAA